MGNSESSVATVSDYAESVAEETNTHTLAQNVVHDMSSVVAQQEMFIQKLTAENQNLKTQLDAAETRKKQYKALCSKNGLI
jgi:hypothetical protein